MESSACGLIVTCLLSTIPSSTPALAGQASAATPKTQAPSPEAFERLRRQAEEARVGGRADAAIALYKQALALQPSWTEGHWYLGTISYDTDRHRECRDAFARVVADQPDNGAAWAFRALCEFRLRQYAAALDHLNRAEQAGVGDDASFQAIVGYHRAILLARAGEFERALDLEVSFVRGGNTTPAVLDALGIALLRMPLLPDEVPAEKRELVQLAGRAGAFQLAMMKEPAEQAFADLLSRYPDAPNVHYIYGAYLARDRPDEALAQYKIELARFPNHVLARIAIADELVKRSDFAAAGQYAKEAVRLQPRNFVARRVHGQIKLHDGDVAGAIADLETAAKLEPSSPSVRFQLARAYQRAGRAADADRERAEFRRLEKMQQAQRGASPQ